MFVLQDASLASILGLSAALSWGASDFSGGFLARRAPLVGVMLIAQAVGLVLLLLLALLLGEPLPSFEALAWGGAAGVVGFGATLILFRTLASGSMGVAAPVIGMLALALPVFFGVLTEGFPEAVQVFGFTLVATSIWILSGSERAGGLQGLRGAVGAGLGLGLYLILLDQAGAGSIYWPLVAARAGSCTLALLAVVTAVVTTADRQVWRPQVKLLPLAAGIGILDVLGNVCFVLSSQLGRLDVSAVLSSLFPAVTVALAWLVLKEPMSRGKSLGILLSIVATPLIAM